MIGMAAAFGVAVAYGVVELFIRARSVLIISGLAMFIAAGLGLRRGLARAPPHTPVGCGHPRRQLRPWGGGGLPRGRDPAARATMGGC